MNQEPLEFTKPEMDYVLQILLQRPLGEALPLYLKMTGQQLAPAGTMKPQLQSVP